MGSNAEPTAPDVHQHPHLASSRRTFLKGAGVVAAGGVIATMPGSVLRSSANAATGPADSVLVVISLRGGADGLSMVVPYGDPALATARAKTGIPPSQLLQMDDTFGLHPNFGPLEQMWKANQMAAVQAVGLANPNLSHFSAIDQIEEANPNASRRVGWLNRVVGQSQPACLYGAVQIGQSVPDIEIFGDQPTLATADLELIQVYGPVNAMPERRAALDVIWGDAQGPLGSAGRDALQTADDWSAVLSTPVAPQHGAHYPTSDLGGAMAQAGRLIRADDGVEVITLDHSSWDMHNALGNLSFGTMRNMIDDLAKSLAALFTDIGALASKVTVVTISEFGRRVKENGNAGADHGWGNVMLLLGAGVNGGKYYAKWPTLDPKALLDGNLVATTDYRSVLAEVVASRFPDVSVPQVFPGFTPTRIGVMQGT